MVEYQQFNGEKVTFDEAAVRLYCPHASGVGTRVILDLAGGTELHLQAPYDEVRAELSMSFTDRFVRSVEARNDSKAVGDPAHWVG